MNVLHSPIGDSTDAADELPRMPLAAALGAFSAVLFAVSCLFAAAIHFIR